jgi:hypothetical protein
VASYKCSWDEWRGARFDKRAHLGRLRHLRKVLDNLVNCHLHTLAQVHRVHARRDALAALGVHRARQDGSRGCACTPRCFGVSTRAADSAGRMPVVLPSPAWSLVLLATPFTSCAPRLWYLSSNSIDFATVTPSFVIFGAPYDCSMATFRPCGRQWEASACKPAGCMPSYARPASQLARQPAATATDGSASHQRQHAAAQQQPVAWPQAQRPQRRAAPRKGAGAALEHAAACVRCSPSGPKSSGQRQRACPHRATSRHALPCRTQSPCRWRSRVWCIVSPEYAAAGAWTASCTVWRLHLLRQSVEVRSRALAKRHRSRAVDRQPGCP